MKITNTTNLEKSGQYFKLVTKEGDRHFGTLYQALQAMIESDYDLDGDLQEQFISLMECIEKGKEVIKKEFRVEVLKC